MKKGRILIMTILGAVSVLLSGCSTMKNPDVPYISFMPYTPKEYDVEAKRFQPSEGKSNIYIARKNTLLGAAQIYDILIDSDRRRVIGVGTYILCEVLPGNHVVEAIAQENEVSVTIDAAPGVNYFVEINSKTGMVGSRVSAQLIEEEKGRKLVLGGRRVGLVIR